MDKIHLFLTIDGGKDGRERRDQLESHPNHPRRSEDAGRACARVLERRLKVPGLLARALNAGMRPGRDGRRACCWRRACAQHNAHTL
jgi:hypothetical protein